MAFTQNIQLILLALCLLSISGVTSKAMEEPDLDYSDCQHNFVTLEKAVFTSGENRFELLSRFYPARQSPTIFAYVKYYFCDNVTETIGRNYSNCNKSEKWWWTIGSFYFIQTPAVFRFTSLLFVFPHDRIANVTLVLPMECVNVSRVRSYNGEAWNEGMLEILTQRLRLYAQHNSLDHIETTDDLTFFSKAIPANRTAYEIYGKGTGSKSYVTLPFFFLTIVLPVVTVIFLFFAYLCNKHTCRSVLTNSKWFATFAALMGIGICFTLFVVALDICALIWAYDPQKYDEWMDVEDVDMNEIVPFKFVIVTTVIDMLCALIAIALLICATWYPTKCNQEKCMELLCLVFVGPLGCLSSHICYIVVGWLSNPFHGGGWFVLSAFIFLFYLVLGQALYTSFEKKFNKRKENKDEAMSLNCSTYFEFDASAPRKPEFSYCSMYIVIFVLIGLALFTVYVFYAFSELPLIGAAESTPEYLLTFFQIAILMVTVILSYEHFFGGINKKLLMGAIDNMKYLKQQQAHTADMSPSKVSPKAPKTDTEVQKAAAILGAVGYKLLFDSMPQGDEAANIEFLKEQDMLQMLPCLPCSKKGRDNEEIEMNSASELIEEKK